MQKTVTYHSEYVEITLKTKASNTTQHLQIEEGFCLNKDFRAAGTELSEVTTEKINCLSIDCQSNTMVTRDRKDILFLNIDFCIMNAIFSQLKRWFRLKKVRRDFK